MARLLAKTTKDKIVIVGYSWGGVLAMHLSRVLVTKNKNVTYLGIIDAANGFYSDKVNRNIPSNVKSCENWYETNPVNISIPIVDLKIFWSSGFPANGSNVNNLHVITVGNNVEASHGNIDEYVYKSGISNTIILKMK